MARFGELVGCIDFLAASTGQRRLGLSKTRRSFGTAPGEVLCGPRRASPSLRASELSLFDTKLGLPNTARIASSDGLS